MDVVRARNGLRVWDEVLFLRELRLQPSFASPGERSHSHFHAGDGTMPKLSLDVADLKVSSFEAVSPQSDAMEKHIGYTTLQACTVPKYSCQIACPSQEWEG